MQSKLALNHDTVRNETNRGTDLTQLKKGCSYRAAGGPARCYISDDCCSRPERLVDTTSGEPQAVKKSTAFLI